MEQMTSRKNYTDKKTEDCNDVGWIGIGIMSIVGSITIAQLMSSMSKPLVLDRYLYPVSVMGWLIISAGVSRLTTKKYIHATVRY